MEKKYTGPLRFAHMGMNQIAPANTLPAYQAAYDFGCEAIECDINMSKDGEIIMVHDKHLTRYTCGHPTNFSTAYIRDLTVEELKQFELPYACHLMPEKLPKHSIIERIGSNLPNVVGDYREAYKTEPRMAHFSTLPEFNEWLKGKDMTVEVEFKVPGMMKRFVEVTAGTENIGKYICFTGDREVLSDMQAFIKREGKPEGLRMGANIRWLTDEIKELIKPYDLFEVGLNAEDYGKDEVKYLNDRGIQVLSNLGDDPSWWEQICQNGTLGFKTNYVKAFTDWWMETKA